MRPRLIMSNVLKCVYTALFSFIHSWNLCSITHSPKLRRTEPHCFEEEVSPNWLVHYAAACPNSPSLRGRDMSQSIRTSSQSKRLRFYRAHWTSLLSYVSRRMGVRNGEFWIRTISITEKTGKKRMTHRNHSTARSSPTASDGIFIAVSRIIIVTIPALGTDGTANVDKAVRILKTYHESTYLRTIQVTLICTQTH